MPHHDEEPLPPYAYVPGGRWPHPTGSPRGHSAGRAQRPAPPIGPEGWTASPAYRRGLTLFNAGYYWEAHEEWEQLWNAHGRTGPTADILRALIKLAAAGVKVRQRQRHGVVTHARRASALFASAAAAGPRQLGLDLAEAAATATRISADPPGSPSPSSARVARVFTFRIEPRRPGEPGGSFPEEVEPASP